MKIAFISDIHGNAVALEAVLNDIVSKNVDKIVVLGDICFKGPEPKRSLKMIQELDADVIKGNADEWLVRGIRDNEVPKSALEIMQKEVEWCNSRLNKSDLLYLENLPHKVTFNLSNDIKVQGFHATQDSLFKAIKPDATDKEIIANFLNFDNANITLYGHIHLPFVRFMDGKCIANTGSVGLPFDGFTQASYIILEEINNQFSISIQRVKYDVERVLKQLKEFNYPNAKLHDMIKSGRN